MREHQRSAERPLSPLPSWLGGLRVRRQAAGSRAVEPFVPSAPRLLDAAVGTVVVATDLQGRVTVFSAGAERLLGYPAADVVGEDVGLLVSPTEPEDPAELHHPAEDDAPAGSSGQQAHWHEGHRAVDVLTEHLRESDRPQIFDRILVRADGSHVTVSLTVSALTDDQGTRTGFVAVGHDVTELRSAQARAARALVGELTSAKEAVERMHEGDRATTDFVSTVCHELRTPITSIMGYTELLAEGAASDLLPEQHSLLSVVSRNSHRLLVLIEDLLTLSRIESGAHAAARRPVDLRDAANGAREALRPTFEGRQLDITFDLPAEPVTVLGDDGQLERAVLNLLTNAVKFTEDGGTVGLRLSTEGGTARLVVSDSGIGIPEEEQHRLFTRFFRSSVATGHAIQGTGLGLSIVRSVVTSHGGEVEVTSAVGQGTTVTIELPLCRPSPTDTGGRSLEAAR